MKLTVGVDIGGTKLLAGVVDTLGRVVARTLRETPHRSMAPAVVENTLVEAVDELRLSREVSAVGVGAAGFVAIDGSMVFAPHLPWRNEPLQRLLAERLQLPVVVDNDANTAARAEMRFGAGRGLRHALLVTLGTGIGGGLVVDGRVVRGGHGLAGEFGHMQVVPGGRPCQCGHLGCWEQYCSGRALVRAAEEAGSGRAGKPSGRDVTAAASAGEAWALTAFDEVGSWLGVGLAGLAAAFDPEIMIVGGGLSAAGDFLLEPARREFANRLPGGGFRPQVPIVRAALGPDAGFIGAADLARESVTPTGRVVE